MVATLEDLCARHNAEIAKYDELDVNIVSCDEAYLNGLEDGKEEGYAAGYRQALHDSMGHDVVEYKIG